MERRYQIASFLSDYGHADEFVGVVHAVFAEIAPHVRVLDLNHEIPPFDVRAGALCLARCAPYLPEGVVLAIVDPGVGTERRAVAVEVAEGAGVFLGPDNGVLAPAVAMAGGATRAVELTNTELHLDAPGPTFSGRDVFAPVAAHLCNGVPLEATGTPVDPFALMPSLVPVPREEQGGVAAEVLWVDRFGNAQLNVDPDDVAALGEPLSVAIGDDVRTMVRASSFAELPSGQYGLIVDSYGLLAIAAARHSAAAELSLSSGTPVIIRPAGR